MNIDKVQIVIRINLAALIQPNGLTLANDYETVSNVLFGRRGYKETPKIRTLVNQLAIGTRTKMTLKEESNQDSILVFWRYDNTLTTLPRFETELISLYEKGEDRKFDLINKNKSFLLISTDTIRVLSPPELMYLKHQLDEYLDRNKALNEVKIFCK